MHSETRSYRTGGEEVVLDLTRDAADVRRRPRRRAGARLRAARDGRARDPRDRRRLRRRPARGAGRPAARRRPLAAPPRLAGARSLARDAGHRAAVLHRARPRRTARARHLAEHLPGRPQRRQRRREVRWSFLARLTRSDPSPVGSNARPRVRDSDRTCVRYTGGVPRPSAPQRRRRGHRASRRPAGRARCGRRTRPTGRPRPRAGCSTCARPIPPLLRAAQARRGAGELRGAPRRGPAAGDAARAERDPGDLKDVADEAVVEAAVQTFQLEEARPARRRREVGLVEDALRGRRYACGCEVWLGSTGCTEPPTSSAPTSCR